MSDCNNGIIASYRDSCLKHQGWEINRSLMGYQSDSFYNLKQAKNMNKITIRKWK